MTTATIPVTVSEEALLRIDELGLRREFEQIVEHSRTELPGLRSLHVRLQEPHSPDDWPAIILWANRPDLGEADPTAGQWDDWMIRSFPPEIGAQFVLLSGFEDTDGR